MRPFENEPGSDTTVPFGSKTATVLTSLFSFCAGTLLMILPWSAFWEANHFLQLWPPLEAILLSDVARIAVTGLGVADFLLGITEMQRITHPTEQERPIAP